MPRRRHLRPREKGEVGARVTLGVRIKEVVRAGIVLVDAALDQAHAEDSGVEVEVFLRRSGDGRDVVEAVDVSGHDTDFIPGIRSGLM